MKRDDLYDDDDDLEFQSGNSALTQFQELLRNSLPGDIFQMQMQLDSIIPRVNADDIDVSQEIAEGLRVAKMLVSHASNMDTKMKWSERANTVRTLNSAIGQLSRYQAAIYNVEQFKLLEQAFMVTLRSHPDAANLIQTFKTTYERASRERDHEKVQDPS